VNLKKRIESFYWKFEKKNHVGRISKRELKANDRSG